MFFIFCLFYLNTTVQAFFGEEAWLNMYKNLDKNFTKITQSNFQTQLAGTSGSFKEKINELINQQSSLSKNNYKDCIKSDLATSQLEAIVKWDLEVLYDKISDNCKNSSWVVELSTLNFIQSVISKHYFTTLKDSQDEIQTIWEISSLWIYSDWDVNNSSFDLMDDLEKINDIIFASKFQYNWVEEWNFLDYLESLNDKKKKEIIQNTKDKNVLNELTTWEKAYQEDTWWNFLENLLAGTHKNSNICVDPQSGNHWLDLSFLEDLNWDNKNSELIDDLVAVDDYISSTGAYNSNTATDISWGYQAVNDNSQWNCKNYFCVTVDFSSYNHQILWWWENITIEYLIDRSNKHLYPFTNSSLIPAKMTVNNFELWLSNIDLAEMLSMGFHFYKKPVPILSLKSQDSQESNNSKHGSNALLEKYYKAYWLDYNRRNDLFVFTKRQEELSSIIQSVDSSMSESVSRIDELSKVYEKKQLEAQIIKTDIKQQFNQKHLQEFHNQLIEINNFTKSITQYTQTLWDLIVAMDKIKTDW